MAEGKLYKAYPRSLNLKRAFCVIDFFDLLIFMKIKQKSFFIYCVFDSHFRFLASFAIWRGYEKQKETR